MANVLITGGSGLIGKRLSELLTIKGFNVFHLSRQVKKNSTYKTFKWNITTEYIDKNAFKNIDHIIHLAGESVTNKRWTNKTKKLIYNSRIKSIELLLKSLNTPIKTFVSASGISYYGAKTTSNIFSENDSPGNDFLAQVSVDWEKSAEKFNAISKKVVCIRTPLVLSPKGGGLSKIMQPIKFNVGSALGNGKQYMPWIHLDDLCNIYIESITNPKMNGIYNAVSNEHCTNLELTKAVAYHMNKKLWAPKVPAFILKIVLGEMSQIILNGSRINNNKLKLLDFNFNYNNLNKALKNCIKKTHSKV